MINFLLLFFSWIFISIWTDYYLRKNFPAFQEVGQPNYLFIASFFLFAVHKTTSLFLYTREFIFLFMCLLTFGLFLISLFKKTTERKYKKEKSKINKVAAESQVYRLSKKNIQDDNEI